MRTRCQSLCNLRPHSTRLLSGVFIIAKEHRAFTKDYRTASWSLERGALQPSGNKTGRGFGPMGQAVNPNAAPFVVHQQFRYLQLVQWYKRVHILISLLQGIHATSEPGDSQMASVLRIRLREIGKEDWAFQRVGD